MIPRYSIACGLIVVISATARCFAIETVTNLDTSEVFIGASAITDALADADTLHGHTLAVDPGTYSPFTMSKALTITSTGSVVATKVHAGGGGTAVTISSSIVSGFTPTIDGLTITGGSGTGLAAGGIHMLPGSEALVTNSRVVKNTGTGVGGVSIEGATATFSNNLIAGNSSAGIVGGIHVANDSPVSPTFFSSVILDHNTITANHSSIAAAIAVQPFTRVDILNNRIQGNGAAPDGSFGTIGAMFYGGLGKIHNNLITGNVGGTAAGAYIDPHAGHGSVAFGIPDDPVSFIHNTVSGNAANTGVGGMLFEGDVSPPAPAPLAPLFDIVNSIIAGNSTRAPASPAIAAGTDLFHIEMPGGVPALTITFLYSHLGKSSGAVGIPWSMDQVWGHLVPLVGPATNVSPLKPSMVPLPVGFILADDASVVEGPPTVITGFPTTTGDWHLLPFAPGHFTADYAASLAAGLTTDLNGVLRLPGMTDIGALQIPEPASVAIMGIGSLVMLTRRRQ